MPTTQESQSVQCFTCGTGHNLGAQKTLETYEAHKLKGCIVTLTRFTYLNIKPVIGSFEVKNAK